ncbi:hypothetical protein AXK11_04300 [Cephaloticoccus primus]|uniref:Uncharacterized protein n=1 Tax=Cephaloticoccus primus TaxID=1548207 RepID=A0A139SPN8_9BACT|nr:hypothetical protein [Cephaloticoccus primus]KXU36575.1 hypothetical protein AXK11_04300 [Cephaloticoccus primus]
MPSLAQLLAAHGTLLVLDAASARVQGGWLSEREAFWASSEGETTKAIFTNVETLLGARRPSAASAAATPDAGSTAAAGSGEPPPAAGPQRSIGDVGAFVFCEGPGSILGIRSAATAIRTWCALRPGGAPVYRYQSLALLAHALADPELTLIVDARREHWHAQQLGEPLRQIPSGELATRAASGARCATPEGFRHWSSPPPDLATVAYDLEALFAKTALQDADLFAPAPEPDAFFHHAPSYKTWAPQIHRAPATAAPAAPSGARQPTAPAPASPATQP